MEYENITNPKIKEIIDGLKYNSLSVENDVNMALDVADNEDDFIFDAKSNLDTLLNEVKEVIQALTEATDAEITPSNRSGTLMVQQNM